ncbi:MAG: hypothetical protein AAFO69_04355 [Bacteroidota bacterium]
MITKTFTQRKRKNISGVMSDDQLFVDCLCDMLEKVEQKSRFTTQSDVAVEMQYHSEVISRVLEKHLTIEKSL